MLAKERLSGQPEAIFGNDFDSERHPWTCQPRPPSEYLADL